MNPKPQRRENLNSSQISCRSYARECSARNTKAAASAVPAVEWASRLSQSGQYSVPAPSPPASAPPAPSSDAHWIASAPSESRVEAPQQCRRWSRNHRLQVLPQSKHSLGSMAHVPSSHTLCSSLGVVLLASNWDIVPKMLDAGLLGTWYTVLMIDSKR